MKPIEESFIDWEAWAFGFGYGTGEPVIIPALREFLRHCPSPRGAYDHRDLEARLGPVVTWLLINRLARIDILEYGTSPRHAWLTRQGQALKAFFAVQTDEQLLALTSHSEDYIPCAPHCCNCGPEGYEKGKWCPNPFWVTP